MSIKEFRRYALAGLMAATPLHAEEGAPTLHASEVLQTRLTPILDIFMETANRDVVALSQDDIYPDDDFKQRLVRMGQIMGTPPISIMLEREPLEIIRRIKDQYQIGSADPTTDPDVELSDWKKHANDYADIILFQRLFNNTAAASNIEMLRYDAPVCLITTPATQGQAGTILSALAQLPAPRYPEIKAAITYDDIYQYVMLHEAAHCPQLADMPELTDEEKMERFENEVETDISDHIYSLHRETEADYIALDQMRVIIERDGRPPELADDIAKAVQAARALGALRIDADIFNGAEQYPNHATHIFDGEPDFDYTESDVFLAVKITTTIVSASIGYQYGFLAETSTNPNLRQFLGEDSGSLFSIILDPEEASSVGFAISYTMPEIQYGTIKAMLEIYDSDDLGQSFQLDGENYINKAIDLSVQMMRNFVSAMETYHPTIANSALAQDSYEQLSQIANSLAESRLLNPVDTPPNEEPPAFERDPNDPLVRFQNSLETPTNAKEALILIRKYRDFIEDYKIYLEIQADIEFKERSPEAQKAPRPPPIPKAPAR